MKVDEAGVKQVMLLAGSGDLTASRERERRGGAWDFGAASRGDRSMRSRGAFRGSPHCRRAFWSGIILRATGSALAPEP